MGGEPPTVFEAKHEVGKRKTTYWTETSGAENENQTTSSEDHLFFRSLELMHDLVIGLLLIDEFGLPI